MHDTLMFIKQNRNIVRTLLIAGYIVAILLISGLARAASVERSQAQPFDFSTNDASFIPLQ